MSLRQASLMGAAALCGLNISLEARAQTAAPAPQSNTGTLQAVVVTAERRTSSVQKTAAAISVRTGEELKAKEGSRLVRSLRTCLALPCRPEPFLPHRTINLAAQW